MPTDTSQTFVSPQNAAFTFSVVITEDSTQDSAACHFEVTGNDQQTQLLKTCLFTLKDSSHASYFDLFQQLAQNFGLRTPHNRQAIVRHEAAAAYTVLLKENIAPGVLYGYGDPAVIRAENKPGEKNSYYVAVTSNDAPDSFPICSSNNLKDWKFTGFVFPAGQKPVWAADGAFLSDYWAPEIHWVGGEYRVYFVARKKASLELCIGMARSDQPYGPFVADATPLLAGNMIDPHVFVEDNGTAFLYWKEDSNGIWPALLIDLLYQYPALIKTFFIDEQDQITASFIITISPWIRRLKSMEGFLVQHILIEAVTSSFSAFEARLKKCLPDQPREVSVAINDVSAAMKTCVYAQQLSVDGSSLTGERIWIIENDQEWEAHLVEGMWLTKYKDRYYLFYSGNDFSTDQYGIGVAVADNAMGPFKKKDQPILKSTSQWWAPGHPSVAMGPDGLHHLFFHAYFPDKAGYKEFRALLSVPLKLDGDNVL